MKLDIVRLRKHILDTLPRRADHIFGCEEYAVKLALYWDADVEKARAAALLHDLTKYYSNEEQLNLARKYCIIQGNDFATYPSIAHAFTAAALAENEYGQDIEIVDAIRWHTTGRAGMHLLEKIVYLADMIEQGRTFPGADDLRCAAFENIDAAMIQALSSSIIFNMKKMLPVYPASLDAYNSLIISSKNT